MSKYNFCKGWPNNTGTHPNVNTIWSVLYSTDGRYWNDTILRILNDPDTFQYNTLIGIYN